LKTAGIGCVIDGLDATGRCLHHRVQKKQRQSSVKESGDDHLSVVKTTHHITFSPRY